MVLVVLVGWIRVVGWLGGRADRCRDGAPCPGTGRWGRRLAAPPPARTGARPPGRTQGRSCVRTGSPHPRVTWWPSRPPSDVLVLGPAPTAGTSASATGA